MSIFKNFNIWWGWQLRKQDGLGAFVFFIITLAAIVGAASFIASFLLLGTDFFIKIRIITGILTPILFYLFISGFAWSYKDKNYKIAIEEAWKFAEKNNLAENGHLLWLIEDTKETKNPAELNEWIENFEKWEKAVKNIKELVKLQKEIPQKIKEKQEENQILSMKLFH